MRTSHRTWSPFNDNLRSLFCHFCNMDLPLPSPVLFLIQNKHLLFGEINIFKWANKGRLPSRQHRAAPHACSFTSYQCCFWNRPSHYHLPLATAEERRGSRASLTATRPPDTNDTMLLGAMDYSLLWLTGGSGICLLHNCHSNHHSYGGPWNSKSHAEATLPHVARNDPEWRRGHTRGVWVPSTLNLLVLPFGQKHFKYIF